eukprot:PhF_6_TR40202/c0_g1_i1/m.59672
MKDNKVFIPTSISEKITKQWHQDITLGHRGVNKLYSLMSRIYYFPKMKGTIKKIITECGMCQKLRGNPTKAPMHRYPLTGVEPFAVMEIDTARMPSMSKKGHNTLLSVIDVGTRYPFLFALKKETAEAIIHKLVKHVFPFVGRPVYFHVDNNQAYASNIWKRLEEIMGIKHRAQTPYHPEEGTVERFIQTAKRKLEHVATDPKSPFPGWENWHRALPFVLWGLRSMDGPIEGISPSLALMGRNIALPFETSRLAIPRTMKQYQRETVLLLQDRLNYFRTALQTKLDNATLARAALHNAEIGHEPFKVGDQVLYTDAKRASDRILGKKNTRFRGPYRITKVLGGGTCEILPEDPKRKEKATLVEPALLKHACARTPIFAYPEENQRWKQTEYRA